MNASIDRRSFIKLGGCFAATTAMIGFVGCGSGTGESQDTTLPMSKDIIVGLTYFGTGLDPVQSWNGWTLARTAIAEPLVKLNENMEIEGVLSDEWESTDGTTWRFHVREGVTFHNGLLLTPQLAQASIQRALDNSTRAKSLLDIVEMSSEEQDLVITLSAPNGAMLGNLADPLFSIIDTTANLDEANMAPVATGPFAVDDYVADTSIACHAYDGYWGGASPLDTVTYVLIRDADTRDQSMRAGDVDVAQSIQGSSLAAFEADAANFTTSVVSATRTELVWLNYRDRYIQDEAIRKALAYAVNREELASQLLYGLPATGPFPDALPYGNDELTAYSYDPEKAREILAAAGYVDSDNDGYVEADGNGTPVTLKLITKVGTDNSAEATYLQSAFHAIGIKINPLELHDNVLTAMSETSPDFSLAIGNINVGTTGDPQYFLDLYFKTGAQENYGGYSNSDLDALLSSLSSTLGAEERRRMAQEASQIILDDCPYLFLGYTTNNLVAKSTVKNLRSQPIDYYLMDNSVDVA